MLLALGGCDIAEPDSSRGPLESEPSREEAEARLYPTNLLLPPPPPPGSPAVDVELTFAGVAPLHRTFFSDTQATEQLGRSMHGYHADPAPIQVSFNSETHTGIIQLQIEPDAILVPVHAQADTIRLSDLAPITVALASYRSDLASRLDFRIESFRVRLFSVRGLTSCVIDIAGIAPPDGRALSPCVVVDGEEHCGQPGERGVVFSRGVAKKIATCLDL